MQKNTLKQRMQVDVHLSMEIYGKQTTRICFISLQSSLHMTSWLLRFENKKEDDWGLI